MTYIQSLAIDVPVVSASTSTALSSFYTKDLQDGNIFVLACTHIIKDLLTDLRGCAGEFVCFSHLITNHLYITADYILLIMKLLPREKTRF